jgi:hypothetical protein
VACVDRSNLSVLLAKVRAPVAIYLANRLGLFVLVYLGLAIDLYVVESSIRPFLFNPWIDGWLRWDAEHYAAIAQNGYQLTPNTLQQPTNFWPVYPMLVRMADGLVDNPFIAGLLISNLALLCSCVMLHRWIVRRFDKDVADRTLTLLLCYPFSFYFSAMYGESVFLLGAVGAFFFSQRSRWLLAAACAAIAGGTRLVGVVVPIALVLDYAEQHRWKLSAFRWEALALPVGFAGTAGYIAFLHFRFGDGLMFLRTQWVPGWGENSSWSRLVLVFDNATRWRKIVPGTIDNIAVLNLLFGCVGLLLCLVGCRKFGVAVGAWAVVTMLISLRIWASAGRYAAVVWPLFLVIALMTKRRSNLYQGIVVGMCLLQALLAIWFSHGHWVA